MWLKPRAESSELSSEDDPNKQNTKKSTLPCWGGRSPHPKNNKKYYFEGGDTSTKKR